ncbi:MAG: hypothetical protein Q9187_004104 [Circinaria calcarea]
MADLNRALHDAQQSKGGDVMAAFTIMSGDDKSLFDVPGSDCHRAWLGIISIMKKRWWNRTWVFQEATVPDPPDQKTWFFCGELSVPWSYVAAAISVSGHLASIPQLDTTFLLDVIYGPPRTLLSVLLARERASPLQFLDLLQKFRETNCTDPRDKVYAPLCLAMDVPEDGIKPDYGKSLEAVYFDVVKFQLTRPGHELDFLGYVIRSSADLLIVGNDYEPLKASWILDWRDHIVIPPFPKVMKFQDPVSGVLSRTDVYRAGRGRPVKLDTTGLYLDVQGCQVDIIDQLSYIWRDIDDPSNIRDWKPENAPRLYPTGEALSAALLRTVVADVKGEFSERISQRKNSMDWTHFNTGNDQLTGDQRNRKDRMEVAVHKASFGRRLCWTRKGYVGVVPAASRVGDSICAFFGGQVLYVLRERENPSYEFMGECYVHGLMDGEVLEWVEDGTVAAETFRLV